MNENNWEQLENLQVTLPISIDERHLFSNWAKEFIVQDPLIQSPLLCIKIRRRLKDVVILPLSISEKSINSHWIMAAIERQWTDSYFRVFLPKTPADLRRKELEELKLELVSSLEEIVTQFVLTHRDITKCNYFVKLRKWIDKFTLVPLPFGTYPEYHNDYRRKAFNRQFCQDKLEKLVAKIARQLLLQSGELIEEHADFFWQLFNRAKSKGYLFKANQEGGYSLFKEPENRLVINFYSLQAVVKYFKKL